MTKYTFTMQQEAFEEFPAVNVVYEFTDPQGLTVTEMLDQFRHFLGAAGYQLNGELIYDHKQS